MRKTVFLLAMCSIAYINNVKAQLKFKNNEITPIFISIVYYDATDDYRGYTSEGWFKVEPNSIVTIIPTIKYDTYYYYAKDGNGAEWTGNGRYKFVIHSRESFKFKNADMAYNESYFDHKVFKNFKKIKCGTAREYMISLGEGED